MHLPAPTLPARSAALANALPFVLLVASAAPAEAGSHLWRFSELYSSPDGKVQFIEMVETGVPPSSNENDIGNHWYKTLSYNLDMSELLGSDLVGDTADKNFLVGTPSYAALPGVPAPDYMIPDGAIDPTGDIVFWWFYETIGTPPGGLPSDGVHSAVVVSPGTLPQTFTFEVNSPTNFAGETGTVVLPPVIPALGWSSRVLLCAGVALLAALAWRRRPRRLQSASDSG